jgi:hypothetical protein
MRRYYSSIHNFSFALTKLCKSYNFGESKILGDFFLENSSNAQIMGQITDEKEIVVRFPRKLFVPLPKVQASLETSLNKLNITLKHYSENPDVVNYHLNLRSGGEQRTIGNIIPTKSAHSNYATLVLYADNISSRTEKILEAIIKDGLKIKVK